MCEKSRFSSTPHASLHAIPGKYDTISHSRCERLQVLGHSPGRTEEDLENHDMTAETALRRSEELLRSIVESAVDAIIFIDDHGRIQAFNPAAERLFGYSKSEVLNRNVSLLMPSPDRENHDHYISRYMTTGVQKIIGIGRDVVGLRKDGSTLPLHLSVSEVSIGGTRGFTGILHDLSAAWLEHQLSNSGATGSERWRRCGARSEEPDCRNSRRPSGITAHAAAADQDSSRHHHAARRTDRIVQDMLMFARPCELRREPLAVRALLSETATLLAQDPQMSSLQIIMNGSADISGDREMLHVVFQNVLMNAAQAMEGRGQIDIAITEHDGYCHTDVVDQGAGMPEEVREKVFDAFFTTKHRGTGLGLPIARRIVESHGGSMQITVTPERGTTVSIVLPAGAIVERYTPSPEGRTPRK